VSSTRSVGMILARRFNAGIRWLADQWLHEGLDCHIRGIDSGGRSPDRSCHADSTQRVDRIGGDAHSDATAKVEHPRDASRGNLSRIVAQMVTVKESPVTDKESG